jgi:pilus assembly protein Flp/PilA
LIPPLAPRWTEDPIAYVWGITPAARRSESSKDIRLKTRPPPNAMDHAVSPGGGRSSSKSLQYYAFGSLCSNLGVPERLRQSSREHEMFGKLLRDESGATAIEYSLIAGFIALLIIVSVGMTGQRLVELFQSLIPALTLP